MWPFFEGLVALRVAAEGLSYRQCIGPGMGRLLSCKRARSDRTLDVEQGSAQRLTRPSASKTVTKNVGRLARMCSGTQRARGRCCERASIRVEVQTSVGTTRQLTTCPCFISYYKARNGPMFILGATLQQFACSEALQSSLFAPQWTTPK